MLEFVRHYRPTGEQEVYDIMNVLDDRLSHSNSAVVMATVKVFLHFTLSMPATHQQVGPCKVYFRAQSALQAEYNATIRGGGASADRPPLSGG